MNKLSTLLIALLFSVFSQAQDVNPFAFKFNHVSLSVKDLDRSVSFYKTILKLNEITNRGKSEGIRWLALGEDKELHLISTIKGDIQINKAVHFAIATPNFEDFVKLLDTQKITYSDWKGALNTITIRADGVKQIYIQDPDGYWIEINKTPNQP